MNNPFAYRPHMEFHEEQEDDWENTWPSNFMAWASDMFLPKWCSQENHWTIKVANYFWADCTCCLFWRGAFIGGLFWLPIGVLLGLLVN